MAVTAALPGLFPTALLRDAVTPSTLQGVAGQAPLAGAIASLTLATAFSETGSALSQTGPAPPSVAGAAPSPLAPSATPPPPQAQPGNASALRMPDVVVFSSAPFRMLAELATAGVQQLVALVPTIEQAVQEHSTVPMGHLANAAGAAARQIADGHGALLAEGPDRVAAALPGHLTSRAGAPDAAGQLLRTLARRIGAEIEPGVETRASESLRAAARQLGVAALDPAPRPTADVAPDPAQRWISETKHLLSRTGDALEQAEAQLRPPPDAPTALPPHADWALTQIIASQAQVATAFALLNTARTSASRRPAAAFGPTSTWLSSALPLRHMAGATRLLGMALLVGLLWLVTGLWSLSAGLVALVGTTYWVWRIYRATQGVRLDVQR